MCSKLLADQIQMLGSANLLVITFWSAGGQEAIPYTNTEVNTCTVTAYLYRSVIMYL